MNIFWLSYGKDSMSQLIVAKELGIPIDKVIYTAVMYDDKISAEHPKMVEFMDKADKILKEKFGIVVDKISSISFKEQFYKVKQKGKHIGDNYGFPFIIGAWCNDRLKVGAMEKAKNKIKKFENVTEFVGIAFDEKLRYDVVCNKNKRSLLFEQKITEREAFEICKKHNLLSPIYDKSFRGGCWFCVKQCMADLYDIWKNYPELWKELETLQKDSFNPFKPGQTIQQIAERFSNGYIPKRRKKGE